VSVDHQQSSIAILDPAPLYTVTIEPRGNGGAEVHFHAGGQGFWIARMVTRLGQRAVLCAPFGGESGRVIRVLIEAEGIEVASIRIEEGNGGYIHDRRDGERRVIVDVNSPVLSRHDTDDLYNLILVEALRCGVAVISGDANRGVTDASFFARLSRDLGNNGVLTMADLSGEALRAIEGGLTFLKVSKDDLVRDGFLSSQEDAELIELVEHFARTKAQHVIVSRAHEPAIAYADGRLLRLLPPTFEPADPRGAGDSMTAGLAIGIAQKLGTKEVLKLAAAAGALNVTRYGLGTGTGSQIKQLADMVTLKEIDQTRR
jgi:1-phosphofructokinase